MTAFIPPGQFSRVCDVCGCKKPSSQVRRVGRTWVCTEHPNYIPRELAEPNARALLVKYDLRAKDARPMVVRETLEAVEADVFRFILDRAPIDLHDWTNGAGLGGTESVSAAAWSAIYLADLIIEDKRPKSWMRDARLKLRELADWLVAHMAGSASSDLMWGALPSADGFLVEDAAAAGLALLRASQVFTDSSLLTPATACAWFVRTCQCPDKLADQPVPTQDGAFCHGATLDALDMRYFPGDLIALEFLAALQQSQGDITIGSPATTPTFSASRACKISEAMDAAVAYWSQAPGFSTATPAEYFDASGRTWEYGPAPGQITSRNWAMGIRAIAAVSGVAAAASRFDWLTSFTSNPALESPGVTPGRMSMGETTEVVWKSARGTYDAKGAPAVSLDVFDHVNASPIYDLAALGHLSAMWSARLPADFENTRTTMGRQQPRFRDGSSRDGETLKPFLLGRCGMSLQPFTDASAIQRIGSVARAAQAGRVFRFPPQLFQERGR